MRHSLALFAFAVAAVSAEQVFEDSAALTTLWQASSSGQTEMFISQLIQNREYAQHRASDGRGPMFWAYEFKNVDTLALLLHLSVSAEQAVQPQPTSRDPCVDVPPPSPRLRLRP